MHGTTVATNALLTRTGGPAALVTTGGFEDVLAIGRQARPDLYDLHPRPPDALIPDDLRLGVRERTLADGTREVAASSADAHALGRMLHERGVRSVAVCLLHSYANADNERTVGAALQEAGLRVSLSSQILPLFREYERTSTVAVDAYVAPVAEAYLRRLGDALGARLRILQSSGGALSADEAARNPVRMILSGPAAGVAGARAVARAAGIEHAITLDMGGTSTDVAVLDGEPRLTTEGRVAGFPIAIPMLEIHTIGAGGGSIAWLDAGGALRVGPHSAGADPGPACYGRGDFATVTDANLLAGRLPAKLLDGTVSLDEESARRALVSLRLADPAEGVLRVVNAAMAAAVRLLTVERGVDPRPFTLIAFGGAGPLHACDVADELGVAGVLIPPQPGLLCAWGALCADVVRDYAQSVMRPLPLDLDADAMVDRARQDLSAEVVAPSRQRFERTADLRFRGQSYELSLPLGPDIESRFHDAHRERYGFTLANRPIEVVALRVRATGAVDPPPLAKGARPPRTHIHGPAVIPEYSATTWVPAGWSGEYDDLGNLRLERH